MSCRICGNPVEDVLDLGSQPPANALTTQPGGQETFPLVLQFCSTCLCVQLRDTQEPSALFDNYLYETPDTSSLAKHYKYLISWLRRNGHLSDCSRVVEAGSNNGLFLGALKNDGHIVAGVEPAARIAEATPHTLIGYFTTDLADRLGERDVVFMRHVLAHNPSPHPMIEAAVAVLCPDGRVVIENAYVLDTLERLEWDQIYGEHAFYFGVKSMQALLSFHGLTLVDVTRADVHGGSLVYVAAREEADVEPSEAVEEIGSREAILLNRETLGRFATAARIACRDLYRTVSTLPGVVACYGASAKGNTLLNTAGITSKHVAYCVDSTQAKQGRYLPGSGIPVVAEGPEPDYFILTAWNYRDEIISKTRAAGNLKTRFVMPTGRVLDV